MRFRHPLVLLLGGLLSASSVGCSAVTAVISDTRPAAKQGRGSADKYAAIARVYESQGRYDQAEAMYRRALKQNPGNAEVRNSLQQLASRKAGRTFGNSENTEAVAKAKDVQKSVVEAAVALNAKAPEVPANLKATAETELKTAALAIEDATNSLSKEMTTLSPVSFEESVTESTNATASVAEVSTTETVVSVTNEKAAVEKAATIVKAESSAISLPAEPLVSAEQVLAVVETPSEHAELLLNGLKHGDSLETQCLAATLLGDCDRSDKAICEALKKANAAATDAYLRLAICDSRIQRGEHDAVTAKCLIGLLSDAPLDLQVQVCSSMHHFVGGESESACAEALEAALADESSDLRASAALALGDFPGLKESAKAQLKKISASDAVQSVREAAEASIARFENTDVQKTSSIIVMPKNQGIELFNE